MKRKNPVFSFSLIFFSCFYCLLLPSCKQKETQFIIGVSQCSDDEWRRKMNLEMQHEAILHQGVSLDIKTVVDDTEKQIKDINEFIDRKVDLIIVSPNKAAPITPLVERAYEAGIPVVLVDRKISSDKYTAFIGADNFQIGKEVGTYIVNLLKGKGNVVEIRGLEGSTPALERHQGFFSIISQYPEIKIVYDTDGAWLKDVAENKMNNAMEICPDIDLVYAQNDRMAMGAYNAASQAGKADDIFFLGIDALPGKGEGIDEVLENKLKATFIYPTGGDKIIQLALSILKGNRYEKNTLLNTAVVDRTNVKVIKLQTDEIIEQENKINFLNKRIDAYLLQYTRQRYLLFSAVFIVVLSIVFLIFLFRAYHSKKRLNTELEKRNNEINEQKNLLEQQRDQLIELSKRLEEATHAKLVFFTNISHEFRTPLTLIAGPLSSLLSDNAINHEQKRLLSLMQKNIRILLKLIDQIADFRKYENGKLSLQLSRNDLRTQFTEWNDSFLEISKQKHIRFGFQILSEDNFLMFFDLEKLERICFNLLSNAIKFTPEKGSIYITLDKITKTDIDYAVITISNSGKGISPNEIQNIFDRFYQVDPRLAGSGIGLALVKALIELHEGEIHVNSDEEFTTFTFTIPFTHSDKKENHPDHKIPETPVNSLYVEDTCESLGFLLEENHDKTKNTVLIADDNPDIRSYIKTILQNQYSIIEAKNGEEGIQKAVKYVPDIIISDVMMPKVDGIELCRRLKTELSTSHIPIILLTACSLDEQRINGFENGADDYISKPFNSAILEVRIRNLIENRKKIKKSFGENLLFGENKNTWDEMDKSFLERLRAIIEKNLSDPELNVEDLGQQIGLSRTQLYRKVKSLTNYSPNELLKIIRLKKALSLLTSSELNIAEIAYDVGFTSPSYFTKCFKEFYNANPTEYLKRTL